MIDVVVGGELIRFDYSDPMREVVRVGRKADPLNWVWDMKAWGRGYRQSNEQAATSTDTTMNKMG